MPDPVSNVEIEDVLSSIRRLVSENAKNATPQALVLTPDDRIGETKAETSGAPRLSLSSTQGPSVGSAVPETARKEPVLSRSMNSPKPEASPADVAADLPPMPQVAQVNTAAADEDAIVEAAETQALEETISHIEANVAGTDVDWEPDDVFISDNDPVEPEVAAPLSSQIDMDELREIVVDTIRSELRGALGEKITRNVRKLVRREIQRAATSNDMV